VYEYEPAGVGSCATSQTIYSTAAGGCQSLISSGTSPQESAFLDASESGGDVFFLTLQKVLRGDENDAPHVYDAHECTPTAPCFPTPPVPPPPCETGEACKAAPNPEPATFGQPPSATFSGAGNLAAVQPAPTTKRHSTGKPKPKPKRRHMRHHSKAALRKQRAHRTRRQALSEHARAGRR